MSHGSKDYFHERARFERRLALVISSVSLAMLEVDLVLPSIIIGIVTAGMTLTGMLLGRRLQESVGKRAELLGGLVLIAIGLHVL